MGIHFLEVSLIKLNNFTSIFSYTLLLLSRCRNRLCSLRQCIFCYPGGVFSDVHLFFTRFFYPITRNKDESNSELLQRGEIKSLFFQPRYTLSVFQEVSLLLTKPFHLSNYSRQRNKQMKKKHGILYYSKFEVKFPYTYFKQEQTLE